MFVQVGRLAWKWLLCSWFHRKVWTMTNKGHRVQVPGRCYPRVDIPEGEPGADFWHCSYCHPCGEDLNRFFNIRKGL